MHFYHDLFDLVEAQCNSAIVEQHLRIKLMRNQTYAIEISQHNANIAFFAILDRKRVNILLKKANIYKYCNQNGTELSSMYRNALLTKTYKKKF